MLATHLYIQCRGSECVQLYVPSRSQEKFNFWTFNLPNSRIFFPPPSFLRSSLQAVSRTVSTCAAPLRALQSQQSTSHQFFTSQSSTFISQPTSTETQLPLFWSCTIFYIALSATVVPSSPHCTAISSFFLLFLVLLLTNEQYRHCSSYDASAICALL